MTCSNSRATPGCHLGERCGDRLGPLDAFCLSFAVQRESWTTCMYVRLLGPCFKTGGRLNSNTSITQGLPERASLDGETAQPNTATEPKPLSLSADRKSNQRFLNRSRVLLSAVRQGATPPTPFNESETFRSHQADFMLF